MKTEQRAMKRGLRVIARLDLHAQTD